MRPEAPHWPLVVMTVLTQLSVGAFATIWLLQLAGATARLGVAALGSLILGGMALASSTTHLGRPIHAYRALKMWKRSWLSREVLLFGCFSGMAGALCRNALAGLAIRALELGGADSNLRSRRHYGERFHLSGASTPVMEHQVHDLLISS